MSLRFALGSEGCVECLYIEKEIIPAVWTVFLIFVITTVFTDRNLQGTDITSKRNVQDKRIKGWNSYTMN